MPIKSGGKSLYPLELSKIKSKGVTVYDRDTRGKSYFYLAIVTDGVLFITSDGLTFCVNNGGFFTVREQ